MATNCGPIRNTPAKKKWGAYWDRCKAESKSKNSRRIHTLGEILNDKVTYEETGNLRSCENGLYYSVDELNEKLANWGNSVCPDVTFRMSELKFELDKIMAKEKRVEDEKEKDETLKMNMISKIEGLSIPAKKKFFQSFYSACETEGKKDLEQSKDAAKIFSFGFSLKALERAMQGVIYTEMRNDGSKYMLGGSIYDTFFSSSKNICPKTLEKKFK